MSEAVLDSRRGAAGFQHLALFYSDTDRYLSEVLSFIRGGMSAHVPVFVAVPGPKVDLLRDALGAEADDVSWADMTKMGHNPAWIIPRVRAFLDAHPDQAVRYVGEPIWASRSAQEIQEATRHEALINLAFADTDAAILCPYDTEQLNAATLANAEHTHPVLVREGEGNVSLAHLSTRLFPPDCDLPLPPPPVDAVRLVYRDELPAIRSLVAGRARDAGLPEERVAEIVLVVNELVTNTLYHT